MCASCWDGSATIRERAVEAMNDLYRQELRLWLNLYSALGEAGEEGSRGIETATGLRPAADSVGTGGVLSAGRCATGGGVEASGEHGGSVSSGTSDRAEVRTHLQMGEPALQPAAGPSPGSEANGASERLWKSRCVETQRQGFHSAWKSRQQRGIPTFPQPRRRRSFGYIANVPTTFPKVTFLNGSTRLLRVLL